MPVRSLFLKVVIPTIVLVLASTGAVSFVAMKMMGEGVRAVASQRAQFELAEVRSRVDDVMQVTNGGHREQLQLALERLGRHPDVEAVRILSASGKVLNAWRPAEVGQLMPGHVPASTTAASREVTRQTLAERSDVFHAATPIANESQCASCHGRDSGVLGFIDVDISLSRQSAGMRRWGTMAVVTAVAQFAVICIGIALILSVVVVRPVRRLSASMDQVQHGNLTVVAVPPGTIEIDGLVAGFNDMVARLRRARQVEEDAQRAHLARVEQLATLGEMAASLAHEIRNPLSGTKAAIDVLAGAETDEEPRRILRCVSEELARVDGVVRQLLNFARPKAPVLAEVDLRTMFADAVMLSGPRAAAQGTTLEVQGPSGPLLVLADGDMVLQVIVNLLLNALQALEGVRDSNVVLSTSVTNERVACSVRDNGPGVPGDKAEAIFRPFVTTKPRGTGLGLATSRRLIELQGGRLWLENPGAPGACFTFTLPVFTAQKETGG